MIDTRGAGCPHAPENNNKMLDTFVPNVMINNNIEGTSEDNFTLHLSASRTRQAGESRPLKDSEW